MIPAEREPQGLDRDFSRVRPAIVFPQDPDAHDRGANEESSIAPPEDLQTGVAEHVADLMAGDTESIPGLPPDELTPLARSALAKLRSGSVPTPDENEALREVLRDRRPGLWVKRRKVQPWPFGLTELGVCWSEIDLNARIALAATGRIEQDGRPVATGFLIRPDLIVTNNHVVKSLHPVDGRLENACIRFAVEVAGRLPKAVALAEVKVEHPLLDLALIQLVAPAGRRKPLALSASDAVARLPVVAVGYPFPDGERAPAYATDIFGDNFGYQTVTPGRIISVIRKGRIEHDCATLGGNSGSPLIDLSEGTVIGVQAEGSFLSRNLAMPASGVRDLLPDLTS